jgi:ketosteroid isomerase-like protein
MSRVDAVRTIYAAMKAGDGATLDAWLAADVVWEHGAESHKVPWIPFRQGKADVASAFSTAAVDQSYTFEPSTFFEADDRVTALVTFELHVPVPGNAGTESLSWQETHQWFFDADGRVTRFRQKSEALAGESPVTARGKVLPFVRAPRAGLAWH